MNSFNELIEYIGSLHKEPGMYSMKELIDIGNMHKSLPRNQKSWRKITDKVGYPGTPDSYRKMILRYNDRMSSSVDSIDNTDILDDDTLSQSKEYKEKTQIRDIYNAYRLMLRKEARVESFKESLVDAVSKIPPFSTPNYVQKRDGHLEAILMFSDMHIGVNCRNFYNTYNYDVAKSRIAKLVDDTKKYCSAMNVSDINVVNLGDLIQGIIHSTARIKEELNLVDQITKAAELTSYLLVSLSNAGFNVTYRSCTDNHSRAMASKDDNIEEENFNLLIDWYLKARLANTDIKFIDDNIDASIGKFDLKNGKKIMFAHGHLENVNKCVDAFMGGTKEFIDYVLLSHFHNAKEKGYNGAKVFVNGSIVGTEDYAFSKRLFGPAEQKLLIFDNDNVLDININLQI